MGKGQNEGGFSEEQLQMYKDCFKLMDINKDGTIDKNDLRGAFDNVGVLMTESELDDLLGEVGGACTYDNMVKMFQEKMAGGKIYQNYIWPEIPNFYLHSPEFPNHFDPLLCLYFPNFLKHPTPAWIVKLPKLTLKVKYQRILSLKMHFAI